METNQWKNRLLRWAHDTLILLGCVAVYVLGSVFWGAEISYRPSWEVRASVDNMTAVAMQDLGRHKK